MWGRKLDADLKQYLYAAFWRNNKCKIEDFLEHAVRQYLFFKPSGYAEFTHGTLHLISSYFLHKSDPTAPIVHIHQICNTESWPRNDTWKAKEKKNLFFLFFFYWLPSSQKTQKCSDAFSLSAVDFAQCSIFAKIIRPVSRYWRRQIGNRKGVIPKGILLAFELRAAPPVWCPQNSCPQHPGTKLCLRYQSCACKSG